MNHVIQYLTITLHLSRDDGNREITLSISRYMMETS